jgi:hypothetical protein
VILNRLTSVSFQRSYDHAIREFIERYRPEPQLDFEKKCACPLFAPGRREWNHGHCRPSDRWPGGLARNATPRCHHERRNPVRTRAIGLGIQATKERIDLHLRGGGYTSFLGKRQHRAHYVHEERVRERVCKCEGRYGRGMLRDATRTRGLESSDGTLRRSYPPEPRTRLPFARRFR